MFSVLGIVLALLIYFRQSQKLPTDSVFPKKRLHSYQDERYPEKAWFPVNPSDEELKIMMESPVEFYGKVVDQNGFPLIGTEVRCSWPFMTSMDNLALTTSAPDGRFEVTGRHSMSMTFSVSAPPGYRKTETSRQDFLFAELSERLRAAYLKRDGSMTVRHKPDKSNPVIFMLRKIESADSLYHSEQGGDNLPRDGSPRYYSFSTNSGKALERPTDHCVEFRLISEKDPKIPNDGKLFNWCLSIRVPGGGIQLLQTIENADSGDYDELLAPVSGYQEEIRFDFPKSLPVGDWKGSINREFFFYFPDKTYGRAIIHGSFEDVRIETFLNPKGFRNLLFDETKSLKLKDGPR